jgi:REP element-mobilizing transposase RayT
MPASRLRLPRKVGARRPARRKWIEIQKEFADEAAWNDVLLARRLATLTEPPLSAGSRLLGRHDIAALVETALLRFHSQQYLLAAWCVMPNHVHVAYTAIGPHAPQDIHHSWKSYLARQMNRALHRKGTLWERESFDHLIRSVHHYEAYIDYIENNPVEAGLCGEPGDWRFSSAKYAMT